MKGFLVSERFFFSFFFFWFNIALSDQTFSTHVCPQRTRNIKQISGNQNSKRPRAVGRKCPQPLASTLGCSNASCHQPVWSLLLLWSCDLTNQIPAVGFTAHWCKCSRLWPSLFRGPSLYLVIVPILKRKSVSGSSGNSNNCMGLFSYHGKFLTMEE